MLQNSLKNKVSIVVGGTSGIGLAITRGFHELGAIVVPVSRNIEKIQSSLKEFQIKNLDAHALQVDVRRSETLRVLFAIIYKKYGRIDSVINCAGIHNKISTAAMSDAEWDSILETNLRGAFAVSREVFAFMSQQVEGGSIIHISSVNGTLPFPETTAYCVSKAGVNMLTHSLAREWAKQKIRVNAIAPGVIPTELNAKALSDKERLQKILARIPMERLGAVEDIVGAALFLASPLSAYITGVILPVDGGFLSNGL